MTTTPLAAAAIAQLEAEGVFAVIGTVVNPAGLTQAKTVPIRRTNAFADPGLGASRVWHGFAIDQTGIAFTEHIGVVGDQRIRIDLSALHIVGDGLAWAPGSFFEQDGTPVLACSRGTLGRIEAALAEAGIEALVGHEVEFLLVNPDGHRLPSTLWAQYGLAGLLEYEAFVRDVTGAAIAGRRGGRIGADPADRRPHSPPLRVAGQPVTDALRRRSRMRCPPAFFTDQLGRAAVRRRSRHPRYDEQRRERAGGVAEWLAGGTGHPVRVDRVRAAIASRQLGGGVCLLGNRESRSSTTLHRWRPG